MHRGGKWGWEREGVKGSGSTCEWGDGAGGGGGGVGLCGCGGDFFWQESTSITLRIDPRMLSRLKRLAARRYLNYQSMIKQWLAERMEKENPEA